MMERIGMHNFLEESYRIEGIFGDVPEEHVQMALEFLDLDDDSVGDFLKDWVSVVQPDAQFRGTFDVSGVYVSDHVPVASGPIVVERYNQIVDFVNLDKAHPYIVHGRYQNLHPFTDGNGRSGRLLTLRHIHRHHPLIYAKILNLGWLHTWYYISLADADQRIASGRH